MAMIKTTKDDYCTENVNLPTVCGNANSTAIMKNSIKFLKKFKNKNKKQLPHNLTSLLLWVQIQRKRNQYVKTQLHSHIYGSTIHDSQEMEIIFY